MRITIGAGPGGWERLQLSWSSREGMSLWLLYTPNNFNELTNIAVCYAYMHELGCHAL